MKRTIIFVGIILALVVAAFVVAEMRAVVEPGSIGSSESLPTFSRTHDGITIQATPILVGAGQVDFTIEMDTHDGSLDIDVPASAKLVVDSDSVYQSLSWQGDSPGGHHRQGTLSFAVDGPPVMSLVLTINNASNTFDFPWTLVVPLGQ
ncbi:MAG: hypothetical protein COU11_03865 [Candidatus Harrisonbacteria bacterium CG10_big_fil_rev_8_21_14_0_10_49_15]|uniref:DUF4352 domain-containing protein n=1 Tax=Candidatus Harrisonbacteria bacterium CG10_big_fil_rev_8_21_14_0_10_49_15 TaxID=1974587 RepID=A0A2H0UK78_9BACT|nr:MAG: hypothetical protein COU11_03865 [Candidatus Harrisonbacteria bacterium CG10_big_fil_rev_8_21_14_0_10_49_15]